MTDGPVRRGGILAAVLLAATATGCARSFVVASFGPPESRSEAREAAAAALPAARAAWRSVAVRAPWSCATEAPAPGGTGLAARSRAVLESRCDVWLGELEKALAARWQVVGWRALARAEASAGSARAAAQSSGADVVLEVADLTLVPLWAATADAGALALHESDAAGAALGPARLSPDEESTIRQLVAFRQPDGALAGLRGAVELQASPASGGDPVWRYRQSFSASMSGTFDTRILLRGRSTAWRPIAPRLAPPPEPSPAGTPESPEDPVRARLRQLAGALATAAVESLATAQPTETP